MLHFERTAETRSLRSLASGVRLRTSHVLQPHASHRKLYMLVRIQAELQTKVEVEKEALKWLRKRD